MKPAHLLTVIVFVLSTAMLLACGGGPAPTPVPPTVLPTLVPPTTVPTVPPPTAAPTHTPAAAITKNGTDTVRAAFQKFAAATSFRLDAKVTSSPALFQPKYDPQSGDDPNVVTVVSMVGEQDSANLDFILKGFAASFIGVFAGFDPNVTELQITFVDGVAYVKGVKDGDTEAKWYRMPEGDTTTTGFAPQELLAPIVDAKFADDAFVAAGTEILDQKNCGVFEGNRAAFEAALSDVSQAAILNTDAFDTTTIDAYTFQVWACDDGNIHRVLYSFDAHTKADATKKGSVAFDVKVKDYDAAIVIQAPTDAVPFTGGGLGAPPTTKATPTAAITKTFTSLEGEWEGNIGEDSPIQFTVADNKITYLNVNYAVNTGSCSSSGSYGTSVDEGSTITAAAFNFVLTDSDDVKFTLDGKFASNNEASGTLAIKGKTFCGNIENETPWTARHVSAPGDTSEPTEEATAEVTDEPTAEATEQATAEPTPASSDADAAAIVNAVFIALQQKDVTTALAAFDDNVVFTVSGTSGIGKSALQSYMQLAVAAGASFKVSNINDLGGLVTFTTTVSGISAGTYTNSSAIVQDGKISIFTIQ